VALEADL